MPWMEQARLLLRKAHDDATLLEKIANDTDIVEAIVGFHAQQSIEKGVKAVLAAKGVAYPRTHNLGVLRDLMKDNGIAMPPEIETALALSPYAAEFRYDDPPEGGLDRPASVQLVQSILAWCDSEVAGAQAGA